MQMCFFHMLGSQVGGSEDLLKYLLVVLNCLNLHRNRVYVSRVTEAGSGVVI